MIFITISSVLAQSNILIQISIENEYTGTLESPLKYGLSTSDLEGHLLDVKYSYDLWSSCHPQWIYEDDRTYLVNLLFPGQFGELYRCTIGINKPDHKLHGLTASFDFLPTSGVQSFVMEKGIVFKIPQSFDSTSLLNKTMDKFRIDAR